MTLNLRKTMLLAMLIVAQTVLLAQRGVPRIVINSMGHSAKINNLLFTPDGSQLISVSEDKTVRIWNTATGEMKNKFESQIGDGYEGVLYASDLSPDGKLLAFAGYPVATEKENYIVIIDLVKGAQVATAVGGSLDVINALGFIYDGKYLVGGGDDGKIKIWSVSSSSTLTIAATISVGAPVKYFAINPVTKDVAVAADGKSEILIYNLGGIDKGAVKSTPRVLKRHRGMVNKLAYSADGTYLASSTYETTEFFLWKADGSFVKDISASSVINAIAFSSDAKMLVGLDISGKGASYSVPQCNKFADFAGHDNAVFSAAISPAEASGNYMVASAGGVNNEIYLWNPINGRTIRKIKGKGAVIGELSFGQDMELYISRVLDGKPDFKTSFDFLNFNINRNPAKLQTTKEAKSNITQTSPFDLDLGKGNLIQNDPSGDGRILTYKTIPDGNIVVGSDYSLRMYNASGHLLKDFIGHSSGVRGISLNSNGTFLASGGEDQTIILWKIAETGAAPSLRQELPEFADFFTSLPIDSLTKEPSKKAWKTVIDFLKANGDKTYKGIEEVYKNLGETVLPFATLFVTEELEWVCWTPKGYFNCTSSGSQYFGWHINNGINKLADFYAAEQYFEILYKPKQMQKSIAQGKRIEEILIEEGERPFDLGRLHTPSAGFIEVRNLINNQDVQYLEGKLSTAKTSLTLDVEVFDGGGGVREVNIYQNDKLIITDPDYKTRQGDRVDKQYKVDLLNETNEFKVIVKNYQKMESKPFALKIDYVGQVMATSSLHIMVVGINNYKNGAYNLNYAQPDASSFVNQISTNYEKIFKTVNKVEIYNEDATKENIIKGFNSVIAKARPEDVFVFFYAGHGSLDEDHKDSDGESPFYFVPTDVTKIYGDPEQLQKKGLSANELKSYLTQIRSTKQVVLMDACHSGGALKTLNVRAAGSDEKAIFQLARSSGVVTIASAGSKQFATEFEVLKHGVFTYVLLEALNGKADGNMDGKVTINEIKIYLEERVPELTKQYGGTAQYPTSYVTGNDFPLSILNK